jgi:hypothetical protein
VVREGARLPAIGAVGRNPLRRRPLRSDRRRPLEGPLHEREDGPSRLRGGRSASSPEYEYWRVGWSHICVVDPEIDGLTAAIVANGGRQISDVWELFEGQGFKMVYTLDPWGNMVEIYTHSHTETYGGGARTTDSAQV